MIYFCGVLNFFNVCGMINRIKAVVAWSNLTETQFAKKIGVTQSSLNRTLRGATEIPFKVVSSILANFDEVSAEWLMRGRGEMIESDIMSDYNKKLDNLIDVIAMQQETIKNLQEKIKQLKTTQS